MLSKYNTKKAGYFYRILALPVVLFFVAAFTIKAKAGIENIINPANKITVVIDAGHGGSDAGASALDGSKEKDLNLAFARRIKELNQLENVDIVFTRTADLYQSPREKADLTARANADLFISIHASVSAPELKKESGLRVFISKDTYTNSHASRLFASTLIAHFSKNYNLDVNQNPQQRKVGIAVVQLNNIPSVVIEMGDISDKGELTYLQTNKAKDDFARNVLAAISQYAANRNSQLLPTSTGILNNTKDTTPAVKAPLGFYKGQKIKTIEVSKDCEIVQLQLDNGNLVSMSMFEAKKQQIKLPALPLDATPNFGKELNSDRYNIDASERLTITGDKIQNQIYGNRNEGTTIFSEKQGVKVSPTNNFGINSNNPPLIILDGKEISYADMNTINQNNIETITVLKGEHAIKKYGAEKTSNGVIEIIQKIKNRTVKEETPTISLSGILGPTVHIDNLKNIKEVTISMHDYSLESATVYFSGAGFKNVIAAPINNKSLESLRQYIDRIEAGTALSFDNIVLIKKDGSKVKIGEKSFIFYASDQEDDGKVFTKLEQEAIFPGGSTAWLKYLKENLNPNMPVDEGWSEGTFKVIVRFVVGKDGSISDVVAENYIGSKTAQMCVDFIKNGPKWFPGRQNNLAVTSLKKQPITFVIQEQ